MDTSIFSENLKKFRMAKKMTQEEVANILGVNVQTVSRWECATTLPDVLLLPQIAKLYGITVDDFYKKLSVAYDNYAQRLSAVYEKTRDPEDFLRCALEYEKLMKGEELSIADKWNYATIHHFMGRYCKDKALEWYDKAIAEGPEKDPHIYRRARSLRMKLMREIGNIDEVIAEQKKQCELNGTYMLITLRETEVSRGGKPVYLLLKKIDSHPYSAESIARKDDTNKPFINDERVLGKWRAYSFLGNKAEFTLEEEDIADLYFKELEFFPEGKCRCTYEDAIYEGADEVIWTKNYLLRKWNWSACEYEIKTIDGKDYMIIEWKSGDYRYGGYDTNYYVFIKENN